MRRFLPFFALSLSVIVACASSSSGSGTKTGACTAYVVPASTDLMTPTVGFQKDVIPILEAHCALAACHGAKQSNLGIYIPSDMGTLYMVLQGPSTTLPSMNFVKPGDLDNSFLMLKLDGDQCIHDSMCVKGTCGAAMPLDSKLEQADRDTIRRWIKQGAKEN